MKNLFFLGLLGYNMVIISSCCSDDTVKRIPTTRSTSYSTPSAIVKGPTSLDFYKAELFLREFKKSHPTYVVEAEKNVGTDSRAVDKFLITRHLRTQSKHIEHLRQAFEHKVTE